MTATASATAADVPPGRTTPDRGVFAPPMVRLLIWLILPPLLLWPSFWLWGASALEDDAIYYLPQRFLLGQMLSQGHWPLWNPYVGLGYPMLADPQAAVFYPASWLFCVLPLALAYPATICLHLSLAGAGLFTLARRLDLHVDAAMIASVVFMFSGFLIGHRVHLTMHHAAAWTPWILWATLQLSGDRLAGCGLSVGRASALLAVLSALQFLAGHAQVVFLTQVVALGWLLVLSRSWRALPGYAAAGVLTGLLIAPQLLPTLHLLQTCTRTQPTYAVMAENSLPPPYLVMYVFPFIFGIRTPNFYPQPWWAYWHWSEMSGYIGVAPLVIATLAVLRTWPHRMTRLVAMTAGGALLLAFGQYLPGYAVIWNAVSRVPVVNGLRCPARWLLIVNLMQALLVAIGLNDYIHIKRRRRGVGIRRTTGALFALALLTLAVCYATLASGLIDQASGVDLSIYASHLATALRPTNPAVWVPIALGILTAIVLPRLVRTASAAARWGLLALVTLDLATVASFADMAGWRADAKVRTGSDFFTPPLAAELLPGRRAAASLTFSAEPPRYFPLSLGTYDSPLVTLTPSVNQLIGMQSTLVYGPLQRAVERRLWDHHPWAAAQDAARIATRPDLLSLFSIDFVVTDRAALARALEQRVLVPPANLDEVTPVERRDHALPPLPAAEWTWLMIDAATADRPAGRLGVLRPQLGWYFIEPADWQAEPSLTRAILMPPDAAGAPLALTADTRTLSNVRFAIVPAGDGVDANDAGIPPSAIALGHQAPRAYVARDPIAVASPFVAADRLLFGQPASRPQRPANAQSSSFVARQWADGPVEIVRRGPNSVQLRAPAESGQSNRLIVLNDADDAGWSVTVNGVPTAAVNVNALVRGVWIGPESAEIDWRYEPPGLWWGLALHIVGWMGLAIAGLVRRPKSAGTSAGRAQ